MTNTTPLPRFFFLCLFIILFLGIFDNTVTNMAGVYIASELGGDDNISVYCLVFFGLGCLLSIPLVNPLADRFGVIRLLTYALLVYILFSVLCTFSATFFLFLLSRIGLGWSAGIFYILCMRLFKLCTSSQKTLDLYMFVVTLMYATVPMIAVSVGAFLAYESHWRWIFYIDAPIALFLLGYLWLHFRHLDTPSKMQTPIDYVGYSFFAIGISSLLTTIALAQQLDWYRSPTLVILTIIGIPSLTFFILWELTHPKPILNIRLLRNPSLLYSLVNLGLLFASYFGMIILITFWLHLQVNYTALWVGVLTMIMGVAAIITAFVVKHWLLRFDPRYTLALALIALLSSCYYSTYFNPEIDFFHLAVARFLAGVGIVLFLFPLIQLSQGKPEDSSDTFSLFQIVRILSSSIGAATYVTLWQRRQAFFHSRLGEELTVFSPLTSEYCYRATHLFSLTKPQSIEELNVLLDQQSTSLALNDAFGFMGYICLGLLILLILTFVIEMIFRKKIIYNRPL